MADIANLEVEIHRNGPDTFLVILRWQDAWKNARDQTEIRTAAADVKFNLGELRQRAAVAALGIDVAEYGQALGDAFFGIGQVRKRFDDAVSADQPFRMKLITAHSAMDLHDLLWETLPDPTVPTTLTGETLATSSRILFSRYLNDEEPQWGQRRRKDDGEPRHKDHMRALVAIANPTDVQNSSNGVNGPPLAPVDVPGELARAKTGLESCGIEVDILASGDHATLGNATLDNIGGRLRDANGYDILYLVCHGQRTADGQPKLWLENAKGEADVVPGTDLAHKLWELNRQPRLVILASCMSAGSEADAHSDDRGELAGVGPLIADAGVPAVLAMQGNITMETLATFMPAFFASLKESGQVDLAVSVARGTVKKRPDAWMPVLFMRLKTGLLWYKPEMVVGADQDEFDWKALIAKICGQQCTVVLGPGLLEGLVGPPRTIAREWARIRNFPLPAHETENLAHIAQYVSATEGYGALRVELRTWFTEEILDRYGDNLAADVDFGNLLEVMDAVGRKLREDDLEPHNVLAQLPFPVYITTNPDNLLTAALTEARRFPHQEVFRWRDEDRLNWNQSRINLDQPKGDAAKPVPTWDQPLVYHLFGHLDETHHSRVMITEDDYFDCLIGATTHKEDIHSAVIKALSDNALLFIGFQMSDWSFRVLLRIIASKSGRGRKEHRHVAVQVRPGEGRIEDTEWARRYLEKYFGSTDIGILPTIYWGDSADFVKELRKRWFLQYLAYPSYPIDLGSLGTDDCNPNRPRRRR
jgi:hypothetical protein